MSIPAEVLLITSGVGAVQSAFLGIYLFTLRKGRQVTNYLLGLLLLAFAIRIAKSITYTFAEEHYVPQVLQNVGYGANLAILPLLWFYLNAFLRKDYHFRWKHDGIHLLPAITGIALSPYLTSYFWMNLHGYTFSLIAMGAYLPFCGYLIYKNIRTLSRPQQLWIVSLTLGIMFVWFGYLANFIFHLVPYITAPVVFSFVIYLMTYLALRQQNVLLQDKSSSGGFSPVDLERCIEKLERSMTNLMPHKDPELTLPKLAKQVGVKPHLLSAAINKLTGQNFSDFINGYRIREAQHLLTNGANKNQKIASIAFDTGFNSLSSFNAAFKKATAMTPSEFRKKSQVS